MSLSFREVLYLWSQAWIVRFDFSVPVITTGNIYLKFFLLTSVKKTAGGITPLSIEGSNSVALGFFFLDTSCISAVWEFLKPTVTLGLTQSLGGLLSLGSFFFNFLISPLLNVV